MMSSLFGQPIESRPLWPHQLTALELLQASTAMRKVLQLPTGGGKTRIAAEIIKREGRIVLFIVPRLVLIEQTVAAFEAEGISSIGVIQGRNFRTNPLARVQIASAQTLARRTVPDAGIVIVDECHLRFKSISKMIAAPDWQDVPFLGLTATP
jgi:DNA repair protein RadD